MSTHAPGIPPLSVSLFDMGPPAPCPARFNLAAHALNHGAPDDKIALTVIGDDGARVWTYGEMRAAVLAGLRAGKTVDELAASITMDAYRDWLNYAEWRELNVRGMARHLLETGAVE